MFHIKVLAKWEDFKVLTDGAGFLRKELGSDALLHWIDVKH